MSEDRRDFPSFIILSKSLWSKRLHFAIYIDEMREASVKMSCAMLKLETWKGKIMRKIFAYFRSDLFISLLWRTCNDITDIKAQYALTYCVLLEALKTRVSGLTWPHCTTIILLSLNLYRCTMSCTCTWRCKESIIHCLISYIERYWESRFNQFHYVMYTRTYIHLYICLEWKISVKRIKYYFYICNLKFSVKTDKLMINKIIWMDCFFFSCSIQ